MDVGPTPAPSPKGAKSKHPVTLSDRLPWGRYLAIGVPNVTVHRVDGSVPEGAADRTVVDGRSAGSNAAMSAAGLEVDCKSWCAKGARAQEGSWKHTCGFASCRSCRQCDVLADAGELDQLRAT